MKPSRQLCPSPQEAEEYASPVRRVHCVCSHCGSGGKLRKLGSKYYCAECFAYILSANKE